MLSKQEKQTLQLHFAKALAKNKHRNQTDKAGVDYFSGHLTTVATVVEQTVKNNSGHSPLAYKSSDYVMAAYLHDSIEDTDLTLTDLKQTIIPHQVINAVDALTRRKGEPYFDYIERVKTHQVALVVKLADLTHNLDHSRFKTSHDPDTEKTAQSLKKRYTKAVSILGSANLLASMHSIYYTIKQNQEESE